jgi:hypothetical protein
LLILNHPAKGYVLRGQGHFVREAKSGGWRNKLSTTAIKVIEDAWGDTMKELGYELATNTESDRELVKN